MFRLTQTSFSFSYLRTFRCARGNLVITEKENLANKLKVYVSKILSELNETRSVRKILELTDEKTALLTDGDCVYGLGECNSAPDVAKITIEGSCEGGQLSIDNTTLMKVTHEHATLPRSKSLDKEYLRRYCRKSSWVKSR